MVQTNYKYSPEDFKDKNGLDKDLEEFYRLLEIYETDKNISNKVALRNQYEDVFYSLKHRRFYQQRYMG